MAGKKGRSGGWNKREDWDWSDLIGENKTLLLKLAKRMRIDAGDLEPEKLEAIMQNPDKRKLFFKSLDIATAVVVKSMPTKLEGTGEEGEIVIAYLPEVKKANG